MTHLVSIGKKVIEEKSMSVGMFLFEAQRKAFDLNLKFRVARIDDKRFVLNADHWSDRINFEADKGIITSFFMG